MKTTIPIQWVNVVQGHEMTATITGIMGAEKLRAISIDLELCGNCLTNQHDDINHTYDILVDESKCEFILAVGIPL